MLTNLDRAIHISSVITMHELRKRDAEKRLRLVIASLSDEEFKEYVKRTENHTN